MEGQEEQKVTMRGLNVRLKGFLDHVNQLEEANQSLAEQIMEWGLRNEALWPDWSDKEALAQDLRAQVSRMLVENADILLQSDAVKLMATDLKSRFEIEENLRLLREQELSQLKVKKKEMDVANTLLEKQLLQSRNELQEIKEDQERELDQHQQRAVEECERVLTQVSAGEDGRVMDSCPDSAQTPNPVSGSDSAPQIRPGHPAISPTASPQVRASDESLKEARAELADARKRWHRLQVEIDSLYATERGLQSSLRHTQLQYSTQLKDLSRSVKGLESELATVRDGLELQRQNHSQLLNTKIRLEQEIATYRKLLENEEGRFFHSEGPSIKLTLWKESIPSSEQNGLSNGFEEETSKPLSADVSPKSSPVLRQKSLIILTEPVNDNCGEICTVKTREILEGNVVRESAEGHGRIETENIDKAIRQWEGSFFKGNPKLRKKSVSLRFDLHMAVADEGCGQMKRDNLPNVEVRLVMKRSRSIHTFAQ